MTDAQTNKVELETAPAVLVGSVDQERAELRCCCSAATAAAPEDKFLEHFMLTGP